MSSSFYNKKHRKDIDGLRAIGVIVVFLFHLGYLPNGYLGVDIFFVISGYLITKIIYIQTLNNEFSIIDFYIRRVRRILPLVSFFCVLSLIIGLIVMLPNDLEFLAQNIIATNFFSNNILHYLIERNYWGIFNEFEPLIHTWSLGIEEQYYLFYPFLFIFFKGKWQRYIIVLLTIISLFLYFSPFGSDMKFYLLPFRFFELSIGGLGAMYLENRLIPTNYRGVFLFFILLVVLFEISIIPQECLILFVIILTFCLLTTSSKSRNFSNSFLENSLMVWVGKISFSIYMWHQVILAFSRYFIVKEMTVYHSIVIFLMTILLSIATYHLIEQPFRNYKKIKNWIVFFIIGLTTITTTGVSFFIYLKAGVIRDVPELEYDKSNTMRNIHMKYNNRIDSFDIEFIATNKAKFLIIGDSYGKDWANVILESSIKDSIYISYMQKSKLKNHQDENIKRRIKDADIIFWTTQSKVESEEFNLIAHEKAKLWCVGTKNFGLNLGFFYNYKREDYCMQRTTMEEGYLEFNNSLKAQWGEKFLDLIGLVISENQEVPIFTPDCKFISQDCSHFTRAGTKYFAKLLDQKLISILEKTKVSRLDLD